MIHADKDFYYASIILPIEIKHNFTEGNTSYIPLKTLQFFNLISIKNLTLKILLMTIFF